MIICRGSNIWAYIDKKKKFNTTNIINSFCYDLISPEEVLLQLQQLDTSKASGLKNLPNKFYKLLAPIISPFLSEI